MSPERSVGFDFFVSFVPPFTFALTMTVVYLFIFELNRIRILLQGGDDFDKKFKLLKIIRGICIFLTFLSAILIAVNNINFNLPEED